MKRRMLCLFFLLFGMCCFARGKQEVIVSENYSSESKNVVVTIVNKTEADFQTLMLTRKEALSDKWELSDRRTFSVRSGESKSVVLDNQGLYKLELFDGKGHKFSKKNTFSQVIKDSFGNVISEGEYQQFSQSWQKLVFTEEDFEPQAAFDIVEVFFGIYGNEKHEDKPEKSCSVMLVNNTGEQIEYISVVLNSTTTRTTNLSIGKGQCGVLDIRQSETADISLISRGQHVYTKPNLVFDGENLTVIFTASDRESDAEKSESFITSALGSISNALSITTQAFASVLGKPDSGSEFEVADTQDENAVTEVLPSGDSVHGKQSAGVTDIQDDSAADSSGAGGARETKKSFWSWLPWVD